MVKNSFEALTPAVVMQVVEQTWNLRLDGSLFPYPSYVNRVFGLRAETGQEYVAKFYRPGRWSLEAITEEHRFLADCAAAEIPVVLPLASPEGDTLGEAEVEAGEQVITFYFALFPKRAGRAFDAEGEQDWLRLGNLLGRLHVVGRKRPAACRQVWTPEMTTARYIEELLAAHLVNPDFEDEYMTICNQALGRIEPLFDESISDTAGLPACDFPFASQTAGAGMGGSGGLALQRIHGDCHRGNILEHPDKGLLLIDFDDMMSGPVVQDLWLLLPGSYEESKREIGLLLEGYENFSHFPLSTLCLIEPLRFMRMIHYEVWCARQRFDAGFENHFPGWGTRAWWSKEIEDLRRQLERLTG